MLLRVVLALPPSILDLVLLPAFMLLLLLEARASLRASLWPCVVLLLVLSSERLLLLVVSLTLFPGPVLWARLCPRDAKRRSLLPPESCASLSAAAASAVTLSRRDSNGAAVDGIGLKVEEADSEGRLLGPAGGNTLCACFSAEPAHPPLPGPGPASSCAARADGWARARTCEARPS